MDAYLLSNMLSYIDYNFFQSKFPLIEGRAKENSVFRDFVRHENPDTRNIHKNLK